MSILDLAETYMTTTKPSERKKQKINDIIDAMIKIRKFLDLKAERIEKTQFKKVI